MTVDNKIPMSIFYQGWGRPVFPMGGSAHWFERAESDGLLHAACRRVKNIYPVSVFDAPADIVKRCKICLKHHAPDAEPVCGIFQGWPFGTPIQLQPGTNRYDAYIYGRKELGIDCPSRVQMAAIIEMCFFRGYAREICERK